MINTEVSGTIFNIQKFSVHDGPGIRTTIFMKGCPLNCRWCSNAESINPIPEPGIIIERCTGCGECISVCPENALTIDDERVNINRSVCNACGECVQSCSEEVITIYGRKVTVNEVLKDVLKDKLFYSGSGGGITVSGGEPLRQPEFVIDLFRKCKQAGIDTCLDTCGYASSEVLKEVLQYTDHVLFDLKHMDIERHREFTGADNERIKENAEIVHASATEVVFRIPLIGGVNSNEDSVRNIAEYIKSLGNGQRVELLPYHKLGIGKYKMLGRNYPGKDLQIPDEKMIEKLKCIIKQHGIQCDVNK